MKKFIMAGVMYIAIISCGDTKTENKASGDKQDSTQVAAAVYQCPMDCEKGKTYSQPGQCPVCGMDLEKKS